MLVGSSWYHRDHAILVRGSSGAKVVPPATPWSRIASVGAEKILASRGEQEEGDSENRFQFILRG